MTITEAYWQYVDGASCTSTLENLDTYWVQAKKAFNDQGLQFPLNTLQKAQMRGLDIAKIHQEYLKSKSCKPDEFARQHGLKSAKQMRVYFLQAGLTERRKRVKPKFSKEETQKIYKGYLKGYPLFRLAMDYETTDKAIRDNFMRYGFKYPLDKQ